MATAPTPRPKGLKLLRLALGNRKAGSMLGFGFSSGLPYALLIGTLNAWLGDVKINLATIGVLSWIGLTYAFKFLWSPLVDRLEIPGLNRFGRRKSWIMLCQTVLVVAFVMLALTDPVANIGWFAIFAVIAAFASATQDVAVDAWRIDVADEAAPVELLSAIYQFGYRTASIVGGAVALVLAARMSWSLVYLLMAALIAVVILVTFSAPDTARPPKGAMNEALSQAGEVAPRTRLIALAIVCVCWAWAIITIGHFMASMLLVAPGAKPPSVADFTKYYGPWIIVATVIVPLVIAASVNWLKAHGRSVMATPDTDHGAGRTAANHMYGALVSPLAELSERLGWGVLIVMGFILTYALCYNIWSSFAFPFYLDFLHYSKDEVAFASKVFGIFMTMIGISLAGYLFARIGRFPTVLLGAILPPFGNLVYADLAEGGVHLDMVGHAIGLSALAGWFGSDDRMMRLLMAISYENISVGLALTAFVAYLSSIVSKKFTAVQYALLGSLTFLVGSLLRGVAGELFDTLGYATVFRWTAAFGFLSSLFVSLEWIRSSAVARRISRETRDLPATLPPQGIATPR
ncbi:AmpG family muropeptide MFS transporter [Sphingomonas sp.]|uniref:AmpG family muropeptide MFS transporter n=1 Tax=Sphingomonas sp. TaxID=28214 RepID=UPI00286D4A9A|nr:MFS transporter [Sphingomonas sp.]